MVLYKCECCLFCSKLKGDYNRHLKTKKHFKNTQKPLINMVMSQMSQKMSQISQKMSQMSQNEPKKKSENDQKVPILAKNGIISAEIPEKTYKKFTENCGNCEKNPKNCEKNPKNLCEEICEKNPKKFECDFCGKIFKTHPNKRKHEMYRCKNTPNLIKKELKMKDKEIKDLKRHINLLLTKVGNTTTNNVTTNNIQLNSYGNEDLSHITDTLKTNLLNIPYGMIPKMIEEVHFNDNKPENKNIQLTNKKENKIKIFSGNKWIYKNKDETINYLIDGKYFILDSHYDNINFNKKIINTNRYEKFRSKYDHQDKDLIELLKKECELVLLNNR